VGQQKTAGDRFAVKPQREDAVPAFAEGPTGACLAASSHIRLLFGLWAGSQPPFGHLTCQLRRRCEVRVAHKFQSWDPGGPPLPQVLQAQGRQDEAVFETLTWPPRILWNGSVRRRIWQGWRLTSRILIHRGATLDTHWTWRCIVNRPFDHFSCLCRGLVDRMRGRALRWIRLVS
jgi:hypothetical protein